MLEIISNGIMTSSGMDISETFRPEDLGKTDFFDYVTTGTTAEMTVSGGGAGGGGVPGSSTVGNNGGSSTSTSGNGATVAIDRPPGIRPGNGDAGGGPSTGSNRNGPEAINGSASSHTGGLTPASGNSGTGSTNTTSTSTNSNNQPLQGFDQFWGPDKDANRLDQTMFDDINRYCWIQQQNNGAGQPTGSNPVSNAVTDTDGQIYTLTVLNGNPEPWVLRKDHNASEPPPPASNLDLDTILGGFPGYVKTECFSYDDSGFGTDHHGKEDPQHQQQQQHHLLSQHQQQQQQQHLHQQVQQIPVTSTNIVLSNSLMDPSSVIAYQNNNNNDWQMSDHNVIEHETPESLLRSALQGKGYTKGAAVQLQNGITVIPAGQIKDEELRRVLYPGDAETLAYADSTLSNPLFDESAMHSPSSNNPQHQAHPAAVGDLGSGVVVDDMFLTLDSAFTEDYEKLKRIASEVQQFCTDNNNYTEIIVETAAINQHQNPSLINNNPNSNLVISSVHSANHHAISTTTSSDVVTTTSTAKVKAPRSSKKYKRSLNNSANTTISSSSSRANNNNNNSNMSNLNTTPASILSTTNHTNNPSPTHCNGQRKERSLHYCSICSKGFKDKYSVNVHIRTHTGEKPFACSLCGKSFRQKAHLAKHYQTHMAQKNPSGSVKGSKQNRAAADQAAVQAAAAAATATTVHQTPQQQQQQQPPPQLPTAGPALGGQAQSVTPTPILLNTATIVASR
ncbi:zinc finger protein sens [Malaya genurostris]|uniref:zinc finger protein sens n=1 Tax=Malaya genurostris TaxID=325434 RepID=UPI0026F3C4DF|nr:zinc finger protein sens [Malaya genurostris]XP_058455052.1 zinc finger protein sens [Malaya genurostris]